MQHGAVLRWPCLLPVVPQGRPGGMVMSPMLPAFQIGESGGGEWTGHHRQAGEEGSPQETTPTVTWRGDAIGWLFSSVYRLSSPGHHRKCVWCKI